MGKSRRKQVKQRLGTMAACHLAVGIQALCYLVGAIPAACAMRERCKSDVCSIAAAFLTDIKI